MVKKNQEKPKQAEVNIGMIGHVDHGKTTLTYALTGKWTDTHSEELRRGISIRLGYADTIFAYDPTKKPPEAYRPQWEPGLEILRRVSFVDAPGHETLLTVMLSGAAILDGAVLVIAANEPCPQPQTEEHLLAVKINGVENLVVVQNKIDLVSKEEAKKNYEEIVEFLSKYGYENVPVIPTSAHHRVNIDALVWAIEERIPTPPRDTSKPFRMWVARSFDINKPGTEPKDLKGAVLGGSIEQGKVKVGDEIEMSPGLNGEKIVTEVVSLASEDSQLEEAGPGGLIAIGTEIDPYFGKGDKLKGQLIGKPGTLPDPVTEFSIEYHPIERKVQKIEEPPFKPNELMAAAIGTMPAAVYVKNYKKDYLELKTKKPVAVLEGMKIAISRRIGNRWRLTGYGVVQ